MAKISVLIALLLQLLCTIVHSIVHSTNNNNKCGKTSYYTNYINFLLSNGEETLPGQWPWVVAINLLIPDELVNKYICTGSILTTKHIITAARCVKHSNGQSIDSDQLYVAFEQFNLRQWHEAINREVASYQIHPDAYPRTGDSDLAILTLRTPVEYSPFIKPICLWSGSTDLENIINRQGFIVGWGTDNLGKQNEESRTIRMPIVSQEDCYKNDPNFIQITSNRTFCAGFLNVNMPCYVDRGSGLVLFNTVTNRYYLRGVVSQSILKLCNPGKYIVYADAAKYIPWIQQIISTT